MPRARISLTLKIGLVLLWLNFPFLWYRADQLSVAGDAADSAVFLSGMVVFYALLVGVWIFHNVRIWKKKGPRRALRVVPFAATHDVLKRPILNTVPLTQGKNIHVAVVDDRKIFSDGSEPQPPGLKAS
jgi:hypothetical protein